MSNPEEVTATFLRWRRGDPGALDALTPVLYAELRRLAQAYMRHERPGHTLQPTALVHEVFLRLIQQHETSWQNRAHFMGVAARIMRRVLVDHARRHRAAKRGGGEKPVSLGPLEVADLSGEGIAADDLDAALEDLGRHDERQARIVELRFFGGLSIDETAEVVGVSPATVKRDWLLARAWLHRELGDAR
jgi:RNA polymerase sigma factor (TIGR02999 family)